VRPVSWAAARIRTTALGVSVAVLLLSAPGSALGAETSPSDRFFALARAGIPVCPAREVRARAAVWISLRCRGLGSARVRVVRRPLHGGLGRVQQRRGRVRYRPRVGFRGTDHFVVARRRGGRSWRMAVLVEVAGGADPSCRSRHLVRRFRDAMRIRIVCRGAGLKPLRLVETPLAGKLAAVRRSGSRARRTLTARLGAGGSFAGQDVLLVRAHGRGGSDVGALSVSTLPWRMRAIGDSVTAGFGYYGDGRPMLAGSLLSCKPGDVVTNRCSSNSDARGGYTGPPEWSADFGLANNVSWAAKFANGLQGGGRVTAPDMFQNRAVTGSAPSDWLSGGILGEHLSAVVAENPDLIAFTIGANPLLSEILLTTGGEECAFTTTVAALEACIQPFFENEALLPRLQQFYTAVLEAPDSTVVTFQYPLAVPSANLFSTWQIEAMMDYFNAQIATAVANTKAALPGQAKRLVLIKAQIDPAQPTPQTLPRFNLGLQPNGQSWTGPYNCGRLINDFVDGPSHQSTPTQTEFQLTSPLQYCSGPPWIIGADSGIHPNKVGYAQFVKPLSNVVSVPPLPPRP
jgi:lysophospholipase L1-like esterase